MVKRREVRRKRERKRTREDNVASKLEKKKRWRLLGSFSLSGKKALGSAPLSSLFDLVKMSQTLDRARKLASRLAGRIQSATATQNASSSSSSSVSTTLQQQQTRAASSGARPGEPTPSVKKAAGPHGVINVSAQSRTTERKGWSFCCFVARFYLFFGALDFQFPLLACSLAGEIDRKSRDETLFVSFCWRLSICDAAPKRFSVPLS